MAEGIKDGASGNIARVTNELKLRTFADVVSRETARSEEGFRFATQTGELTLPTGFDGPVLRFQNDDSDRHFHFTRLTIGYNGGSTNHNRTMLRISTKNVSIPTANFTSIKMGNTNLSSSREALMTVQKWDSVGTAGMTGGAGGIVIANSIVAQGSDALILSGAVILPAGASLQISLTPEEAGTAVVAVFGYFESEDEE